MMEFIYLFLYRALSGAQNGAGYARESLLRKVITILLLIAGLLPIAAAVWLWPTGNWVVTGIIVVCCLATDVGVLGVEDSFNNEWNILPRDIHLWELVATSGVTIAVIALNGNLLYIIAHLYPALLLHKGFVNIGSGKGFWYHGTDDATGKTFAIPLLGIKIPRLSLRGRQILAIASLFLAVATWLMGMKIDITDIIEATLLS